MPLKYYRTFSGEGIGNGAKFEESWTPEESIVVKRIYIARQNGSALTASLFYLKSPTVIFTRPYVPASVLGPDKEVSALLNIEVPAKAKIDFSFENHEGASISVFVTFECEAP